MGQPMTILAKENREKALVAHKKFEDMSKNLIGINKIDCDIKIIKSRIKNCKGDLELFPENRRILDKISIMENQLEQLKKELENEIKNKKES